MIYIKNGPIAIVIKVNSNFFSVVSPITEIVVPKCLILNEYLKYSTLPQVL